MDPWTRDPDDGQVISTRPETGRKRVQTQNLSESRTVQSDRHKASIHSILAQYEATGILPHLNSTDLQFRDVTEFSDFAELRRESKRAEQAFNALPAKIRDAFDHSHDKWLDAAHDGIDPDSELARKLTKIGVLESSTPTQSSEPAPTSSPSPSPSSSGESSSEPSG